MALRHIHLRDFVIVRELTLDTARGFTVLTGETGAGKSILIDALQLALGARADAGVVREGAPRAEVSAEFDRPPACAEWLAENGFENEDSPADTVLVRRTVDAQGKSRAWLNGSAATATQLRELGEHLLDIHGQHAWQSLTRPDAVRALLDAYAGTDLAPLRTAWQHWRQALAALETARHAQQTLQDERERLSWQIAEVDKLAPGADEWDELNGQHTRLAHAQSLLDAAASASGALDSDEGGALAALGQAASALQAHADIEPQFAALAEQLQASEAQARDALHTLRAYLHRAEPDPAQLAALDERLGQWISLARRYRQPPEGLAAALTGWKQQLARLDAAADLDALEAAEHTAQTAYAKAARAVSQQRHAAGPQLAAAVTAAMQDLGMAGGRFAVDLQTTAPTAAGTEDVGFLVAGHAGVSPRPVGKVASGGELSRIALAIAVTTSALGEADTLIFDEVDAGVGGAVAHTVGALMRRLGAHRQVLAVTHLAQVAACADQHLLVSKTSQGDGIASQVQAVTGEARVAELARMLGGAADHAASLAHARAMLDEVALRMAGAPDLQPEGAPSSPLARPARGRRATQT